MAFYTNVSSSWKYVNALYANVAGTWKEILAGYTNVGGTWKLFHTRNPITLDASYTLESFDQGATFTLEADGDVMSTTSLTGGVATDIGDWLSPKSGMSDYEVRLTLSSGSADSGTVGSWLNLGSNRSWAVITGGGFVGTLEIRSAATGVVLDSATLTLSSIDL